MQDSTVRAQPSRADRLRNAILVAYARLATLDDVGGGTGENMVLRGLAIAMAIAAMAVFAAAVATHVNAISKAITGAGV